MSCANNAPAGHGVCRRSTASPTETAQHSDVRKSMTDILVGDHAEVDALLRGVMLAFDGGDAREVFSKLDYLWARLALHIRAEHLHLFPALLSAAPAEGAGHTSGTPTAREVKDSVEGLREDHDHFMRELAEAVNGVRALAAPDCAADSGRLLRIREQVQWRRVSPSTIASRRSRSTSGSLRCYAKMLAPSSAAG